MSGTINTLDGLADAFASRGATIERLGRELARLRRGKPETETHHATLDLAAITRQITIDVVRPQIIKPPNAWRKGEVQIVREIVPAVSYLTYPNRYAVSPARADELRAQWGKP